MYTLKRLNNVDINVIPETHSNKAECNKSGGIMKGSETSLKGFKVFRHKTTSVYLRRIHSLLLFVQTNCWNHECMVFIKYGNCENNRNLVFIPVLPYKRRLILERTLLSSIQAKRVNRL